MAKWHRNENTILCLLTHRSSSLINFLNVPKNRGLTCLRLGRLCVSVSFIRSGSLKIKAKPTKLDNKDNNLYNNNNESEFYIRPPIIGGTRGNFGLKDLGELFSPMNGSLNVPKNHGLIRLRLICPLRNYFIIKTNQ